MVNLSPGQSFASVVHSTEMDYATKPFPKPSNISDIVFKFAKVCRLRSIGVFSSENNANLTEGSSDAAEETECTAKIHPVLAEIQPKSSQCGELELSKLFDTISAMKLAYIQLQEAHIPYDSDKITAANELVVTQFKELYKIKHVYNEKQFKDGNSVPHLSVVLPHEVQVQEKLLEKLKFQVKLKNTEILDFHKELADLNLSNMEMAGKLRKKEKGNINVLDASFFGDIFAAASGALHDFAKPLISLMKASGWDLDQAVNSIESSVFYSKRSHKKYAFEAYIARKMFHGISTNPCSIDCIMRSNDPISALVKDPYSNFAKFCGTKYLYVIHPMMEASFFGNLDHRTCVSSGKHPRTPFYQVFGKMAWRVWVLQGIAVSSEPKAEMYVVKRGTEFSEAYMESVVDLKEEMVISGEEIPRFKVVFMVMPGFKIGNMLVKPRVYLSRLR